MKRCRNSAYCTFLFLATALPKILTIGKEVLVRTSPSLAVLLKTEAAAWFCCRGSTEIKREMQSSRGSSKGLQRPWEPLQEPPGSIHVSVLHRRDSLLLLSATLLPLQV